MFLPWGLNYPRMIQSKMLLTSNKQTKTHFQFLFLSLVCKTLEGVAVRSTAYHPTAFGVRVLKLEDQTT